MVRLLRRRDFALLWFAGLVSVAGDWLLNIALPFYVYERTGSTVATAGMVVASLSPAVVLSSVAGVFVDRWSRRRALIVTNVLQAATVSLLLLAPSDRWLWIVFVVAALQSAAAAFAQPAETAFLPTLVADDELVTANAMNALNNRLARLVGAPAGGTLLAAFGLDVVVALDVASFLVAAALVAAITHHGRPPTVPGDEERSWNAATLRAEWMSGLRLVGQNRSIAWLFVVFGLMTFGGTMLDPLRVAWVRDVLGEGPAVYSLLTTTHAVAGTLGALVLTGIGARVAPHRLVGFAGLIVTATLFAQYNIPVLAVAVAMSVVSGITSVTSNVGVETLAQQAVPDEYRGRVFGSLQATTFLLSLLGALTGGVLAEAVGVVPMLNVASGVIGLAAVVILWSFSGRRERR
jgi:MFS family permease